MSLIRKHGAVLQAWTYLALVYYYTPENAQSQHTLNASLHYLVNY